MSDPGCIFCRVVSGDLPSRMLHRDGTAVAFEDVNAQAPVHVLIVPVEHARDVHDLPGPTLEHMYSVARRVAGEHGIADSGYRMVFNMGPDSGQTVFHAHLHLLGGRRLGWPPG